METKLCFRCGQVKPATEFFKNKTTRDGLQVYCKKCLREYQYIRLHRKKINPRPKPSLLQEALALPQATELRAQALERGFYA